jgi:hypothetical protein
LEYIAAWLGTRWAWALFAFGVGWFTRDLRPAIMRAVIALWYAVLAYYVADAVVGVNSTLSTVEIAYWSVIAMVIGPVMAVVGRTARRQSSWSVPAGLIAPAIMVLDTMLFPTGPDTIRPWAESVIYVAAAGLAFALVVRTVVPRIGCLARSGRG